MTLSALRNTAIKGNTTSAQRRYLELFLVLCLAILPLLASVVIFTDNHPDLRERFDCAACRSGEDLSSADTTQDAPVLTLQDASLLPLVLVEVSLSNEATGATLRPRSPPFKIGYHGSYYSA